MTIALPLRLLSYLWPVPVRKGVDLRGKRVRLDLYRGQWLLSTSLAVYSFGTNYYPFRKPFALIGPPLAQTKRFLLLGTGLGSALQILQRQYGCFPESVLVDADPQCLTWSREYMDLNQRNNVQWVCGDAADFLAGNTEPFDLIGIDLFTDMSVPLFVLSEDFLTMVRSHMVPGGHMVINLMFSSRNQQQVTEERLNRIFRSALLIPHGPNAFYLCQA